jgi:hypothetical protein
MAVLDHAVDSRGLSVAEPETAAWLSLVAYVRRTFTDYDEILAEVTTPTVRDILWPPEWVRYCRTGVCAVRLVQNLWVCRRCRISERGRRGEPISGGDTMPTGAVKVALEIRGRGVLKKSTRRDM